MSLDKYHSFSKSDLFGGTGEVKIWNLLAGRKMPPFSAALWCELEANGVVGRHRQQQDPEIIICTSGEGEATIGKHTHKMAKGTFLYVPLGVSLSLRNSSGLPLCYLIIKAKK